MRKKKSACVEPRCVRRVRSKRGAACHGSFKCRAKMRTAACCAHARPETALPAFACRRRASAASFAAYVSAAQLREAIERYRAALNDMRRQRRYASRPPPNHRRPISGVLPRKRQPPAVFDDAADVEMKTSTIRAAAQNRDAHARRRRCYITAPPRRLPRYAYAPGKDKDVSREWSGCVFAFARLRCFYARALFAA